MADAKLQQIKVYSSEELGEWDYSRLRYLALQYGLAPDKSLKQAELIAFVLKKQKETGGKIPVRTVAKPSASKKADDDEEGGGDEDEDAGDKKKASKPAGKAAKASKPADDEEDDEPPAKRKAADEEEEEDEPPAKKRKVVDEDEEDEPPSKKRKAADEDEEDEPPAKKRKVVDEEEEDEPALPDEEDDEPPAGTKRRGKRSSEEDDEPEVEEVQEPAADDGPQAEVGIDEKLNAIGHTIDEVLAKANKLEEYVDNLREKIFIQSGVLRKILIKSGMGKADVDALTAKYKEDWKAKTE